MLIALIVVVSLTLDVEPEDRHRLCWYSRRTSDIPPDIGFHTIADGELLYCAHPMLYPVVGLGFDVGNCRLCDYFRARRESNASSVRIDPKQS